MLFDDFGYQINEKLGDDIKHNFNEENLFILKFLVDKGLNLCVKTNYINHTTIGGVILYHYSELGCIEAIKFLVVENGVDVNSNNGQAFITACNENHYDIVKFMIDCGILTPYLNKGLYGATRNKNLTMIKILLQAGADISSVIQIMCMEDY